jgi:hypothetical protein
MIFGLVGDSQYLYGGASALQHVAGSDRPFLLFAFRQAEHGVGIYFRPRTIVQVHRFQSEIIRWSVTCGHGLIKAG